MAPAVPEERNTGRQLVTCSPRHDCDDCAHGIVFHCRGQPVQRRVQATVHHSHENKGRDLRIRNTLEETHLAKENKHKDNLLDFEQKVFC